VTVVNTVIFVVGDQTTVPVAPSVPLICVFVVSQLFKLPENSASHSTASTLPFTGKSLPVTVIVVPLPLATVAGAIVTLGSLNGTPIGGQQLDVVTRNANRFGHFDRGGGHPRSTPTVAP
jgi:hypothetical protein